MRVCWQESLSLPFGRGSRVEGTMSRVEGAMSRVEGTMSRVQKYFKIIIKLFLKRRIIKLSKANFVFGFLYDIVARGKCRLDFQIQALA